MTVDELRKFKKEVLKKASKVSKKAGKKAYRKAAGRKYAKKISSEEVYRRVETNLQKTLAVVKEFARQRGVE